jgi:hypothetical protein
MSTRRDRLAEVAAGRQLHISTTLVAEFSPDAMAVMEFVAQEDIDICRKIYERYPRFGEKIDGLPYRSYMREVDMGTDRGLFSEDPDGLPVFEGRMVDAYDYRAKGYRSGRGRSVEWADLPFGSPEKAVQPQWRILPDAIPDKLLGRIGKYRIGFQSPSRVNWRLQATTIVVQEQGNIRCHEGEEDPSRRAELTAEIDVLVAHEVYGLSRTEMLYILDPANLLGENCGIETFKALRNWEIREHDEYRSQRLVLEAWDRFVADGTIKRHAA